MKLFCTAGWREASNYMILTVSPPIYAIGEKKPENIQGFKGIYADLSSEKLRRFQGLSTYIWSPNVTKRSGLKR